MESIAKMFHHNFNNDDFRLYNKDGREVYFENTCGYWQMREYDKNGNRVYYKDSDGFWSKRKFDANGNKVYCENSHGYIKIGINNYN